MNGGLKSGLVLLILGIISGTLLAVVNSFTAPKIEEIEQNVVYESLESFYDLDNYLVTEENIESNGLDTIYILTNKSNNQIGALIYLVSAAGYNGDVTMLIAINSDYSVEGYTIVSQKENPPINDDFVHHDYNVNDITNLNDFDAIAGATYTSTAIRDCFIIISDRVVSDFGGGLND